MDHDLLNKLRDDVRRSSLGGFPMLIIAAGAWTLCAASTWFLPVKSAALLFIFQGMVTMPLGLWLLPKALKLPALPTTHPLTPLLVQCATVQTLMLPAIIAVYTTQPLLTPMAFAAVVGAHFLPYWWIQRSRAYLFGALACAFGPWVLAMLAGRMASYHYTGFLVGAALAALALTVRAQVSRGAAS